MHLTAKPEGRKALRLSSHSLKPQMNNEEDKHLSYLGSVLDITQLLNENCLAEVTVGEKAICIGKYRDQLFAFAARCPHAGGKMCGGYIDVLGNVVCPVHRYKFSMRSGRNTSGEEFYLKTFPVEIHDEEVYVRIS
jgi:nitrite reductase/ring-hydroxylating ferredoxin subunit